MPGILFTLLLALLTLFLWRQWRRASRANYIRTCRFPPGLFTGLTRKYPHLHARDCQLAARALRQFFLAHLQSGGYVSMPSQAADEVWHDFILNTREYAAFCRKAFGHFMHHTPAVVMSSNRKSNEGLRRCWRYTCREENIDPRQPLRLPLLFALDEKLKIPDGFRYIPDCTGNTQGADHSGGGAVHCGGDFSNTGFDGTTEGLGDVSADAGADGGCGGGCGGGGD